VLIIGAGEAGTRLAKDLTRSRNGAWRDCSTTIPRSAAACCAT
jgi:hypothetical protein